MTPERVEAVTLLNRAGNTGIIGSFRLCVSVCRANCHAKAIPSAEGGRKTFLTVLTILTAEEHGLTMSDFGGFCQQRVMRPAPAPSCTAAQLPPDFRSVSFRNSASKTPPK